MDTSAPPNSNKSRNEKTNQNIQVYVRVRPANNRDRMIRSLDVVDVVGTKEVVCRSSLDSKVTKKFYFDRSFGPNSKQSDVYQTVVAPLIEEVLAGYNCTVFAYGQTGTGKTHTMVGFENQQMKESWEDDSSAGIIPRALCHMLDELRLMKVEYAMRISYLELYNEELCDLLSTDDSVKIRIFDDSTKKGSIIIQGLEEVTIHGKDDVYKILERGQERRKTATTLMNAQSSRSHTVLSILVHIKENGIDGEEMLKIGKLNLVDLAGSENISKAGNEKGIRTRETVNINQSLLTLGRVITALVERAPHIPYRESKLTRLLQESLGGRTKTSIIATISPGHKDLDETLSTLEYAFRAKNIQNKPELNQKLSKKTVLKGYIEEIDRLKKDLNAAREKNGIYLDEETYNEMNYKLEVQNKELNEKMLNLKALKAEMLKMESLFTEKLHTTEKVLSETKHDLTQTKKRYKEKKILLDNHIKTEEKLTDQANELIKVAKIATEDHQLLHDTLERRKSVDTKIKSVAEEFKNKMEHNFKIMNKDFENLHEKHKSVSEVIKLEINENTKLINSYINETKSKVDQMASYFEKVFEQFSFQYEKFEKQILDGDEKHLNAFSELKKIQEQKDGIWRKEINSYINDTKHILNEQKLAQESNVALVSKFILETNEKDRAFCNVLNDQLFNIVEEAQRTIKAEVESVKANTERRNQLNKKRSEILSKLIELENEDREGIEKIEVISENLISVKDEISSKINNKIERIKLFDKEREASFKILNGKIENIQEGTNSYVSQIHDQVERIQNLILTNQKQNLEHETSMTNLFLENKKNQKELVTTTSKELTNVKNNSCSTVKTQFKEVSNTIFKNQSAFNEFSLENTSMTKSFVEAVNDYADAYWNNMNNNFQLFNFYQNGLKVYSPTGQTPSKREYTYPKVLAKTSPHSNIIKRFRLENGYSDHDISNMTIMEDNESVIPDINEQMPRISTPIKYLENSPKSFKLNTPSSLTENNPRLIHSLDIYDKKHGTELRKSPVSFLTENKENVE
ncbi:kinesin-like protein Klp61F [Condylostylus longicornis]|uniref:kinesin-like protein Klp61F n=1 Tax=Condylostylus longicornis TaxID=2530218 RepID=UPI00244DBC40|nr:kinesin-like protein Klp61F [Condylostylus longicornis]